MECSICSRGFSARRKPCCGSCAQATLYGPRVEQAAALLGREKAHTHVEAIVRPGNDGVLAALPEDADWDAITSGIKTYSFDRARGEHDAAEARIRDISEKAKLLRQQIEDYKAFASKRKEENGHRRKDMEIERSQLEKHKQRALEPVHLATRKAGHRLDKIHKRTIEAREHLCREVSSLSGLRRVKQQDGSAEYRLGGILLPHLKDLNGINGKLQLESIETPSGTKLLAEPYELVSASLDNVCRFLGICCHYLSIRLPAEIILPHNDFPHAAILPRDSSYQSGSIPYPKSGSSQTPSPTASRVLSGSSNLSRPRLLQLDRALPQLQKEDEKARSFFLEGVALLAYDVAWLCYSQGSDTFKTYEDALAIGRNLHQLFPGKESHHPPRPSLNRNISTAANVNERASSPATSIPRPTFGTHSHASTRHNLAGHEGFELFHPYENTDWNISLIKLSDKLKASLRNEIARTEWHFVNDKEWDDELEEEQPVLVGGAMRAYDTKGPAMSVLSVKPSDGMDDEDSFAGGAAAKAKGNSGWMKIRGRGGES